MDEDRDKQYDIHELLVYGYIRNNGIALNIDVPTEINKIIHMYAKQCIYDNAALMMQSLFRGSYTRRLYLRRIYKVKKATKIIWILYRRWDDRRELVNFLDRKGR